MADSARELAQLRRRKGVVRSSITRLEKRVRELEDPDLRNLPDTIDHARELTTRLTNLDSEFQGYHLQIVDLVEEEDAQGKEQDVLDTHDEFITVLSVSLKKLSSADTPPSSSSSSLSDTSNQLSSRKLGHLERAIGLTHAALLALPADVGDVSLVEEHQSKLSDVKTELSEIHTKLLSVTDEGSVAGLLALHSRLEATLFDCLHLTRKLLKKYRERPDITPTSKEPTDSSGVRLPKLAIPTFDGSVLGWRQFWEQFCVSVHNRPSLSKAEKLAYLQHALKEGAAKSIVEGLSQSGEHYDEAVKCLMARFDRPRLIHRTHVKMILDAPQVRDGSGKEIRRLHDIVQQHIHALTSLGEEPSPPFITSIIELKLDSTTMFEWQRHSQTHATCRITRSY